MEDEKPNNQVVEEMLARFKLSEEATRENRKTALEALKFRAGGKDQWDDEIYTLFAEQNKPRETYNQIPQFVHRITNDMRVNMPQTRFSPGTNGTSFVAEVYEDLARAIQSTSEAEVAYDIAADNQVTFGWGYWRYVTEYENDQSFDQIIKILAVPNAFTIYDDPNCLMQDFSDRKFLIQVEDMPLADFNDEYERKYTADTLKSIGDNTPDWATETTVRVAEYWRVTTQKGTLYRDPMTGGLSYEPVEGVEYGPADQREITIPKVEWFKCTACEVIEGPQEWPGKYIPYVRASGETLVIDGKVTYSGLVEGMMSPQRQYNYWMNTATELVSLAPKSPFIAALGQLEGLEQFWDQANIKNYPWLPYKPMTVDGIVVPPPSRMQNSADISSMMVLIKQAQENFYAVTGIYQASLGAPSNEKSGKAILARQNEGNVSTFHYQDNMARALRFGGRIMADLFPKVYDTDRNITLLKEDKTKWATKINAPIIDEQTGKAITLDMTAGVYDVAVTTGASYATKQMEFAENATALAQAYPQLLQVAGPDIVRAMDWPNADKIADALARAMPPELRGEDGNAQVPPEVQAMLEQADATIMQQQQQMQQLAQALQEAQANDLENQVKITESNNKAQLENRKMDVEEKKLAVDEKRIEAEKLKVELQMLQLTAPQPVPAHGELPNT